MLESTFLEGRLSSGWQDIGAAKGSNAVFWGVTRRSAPSAASYAPPHPQPPECMFFPLEIFLIAASRKLVFLIFRSVSPLLCNCQSATISISSAVCFSLLLCSLSWSFSLCSLPPFSILVIFFNDILFISFSSHADPQLEASFYIPSFHSVEKSPRDSALL